MNEKLGLSDHPMVLRSMMTKIANNLKYWSASQTVISRTLTLFYDLAMGYSSSRLLLKVHTCLHTCLLTCLHTCPRIPTRTRLHTQAYTHLSTPACLLTHVYTHMSTHTCLHSLYFPTSQWNTPLVGCSPRYCPTIRHYRSHLIDRPLPSCAIYCR